MGQSLAYLKQIEAENTKGRTTRADVAMLLEEVYRLRKALSEKRRKKPCFAQPSGAK